MSIPSAGWLTRMPYRLMDSPGGHLACPECLSGEFLLLPTGRIICADDDCGEQAGWWHSRVNDAAFLEQQEADG